MEVVCTIYTMNLFWLLLVRQEKMATICKIQGHKKSIF